MKIDSLPKRHKKTALYTERLTIPVEPEIKSVIAELSSNNVDTMEWLRKVIRKEIAKIKAT